jgi:crossover junction endodeoxyribonuclease RusA
MLPWRTQVQNAIEEAMSAEMVWPVLGPIAVAVTFTVKKPASAPKKRRTYPATRPDVDKLARCVLDALTASGCIKDDGQVTTLIARKVYPGQTWDALFTPGLRLGVMRDDHDD